jgi:hypothetical protein
VLSVGAKQTLPDEDASDPDRAPLAFGYTQDHRRLSRGCAGQEEELGRFPAKLAEPLHLLGVENRPEFVEFLAGEELLRRRTGSSRGEPPESVACRVTRWGCRAEDRRRRRALSC